MTINGPPGPLSPHEIAVVSRTAPFCSLPVSQCRQLWKSRMQPSKDLHRKFADSTEKGDMIKSRSFIFISCFAFVFPLWLILLQAAPRNCGDEQKLITWRSNSMWNGGGIDVTAFLFEKKIKTNRTIWVWKRWWTRCRDPKAVQFIWVSQCTCFSADFRFVFVQPDQ